MNSWNPTDPYAMLAEKIRGANRLTLEAASIMHNLKVEEGSYHRLREVMLARYAIELPSDPTISRYLRIHRIWRVDWGFDIDLLATFDVEKLYLASRVATRKTAQEWLDKARSLTVKELRALVYQHDPLPEDNQHVTFEAPVMSKIDAARTKLEKATRESITFTMYQEFLSELILDSREEDLRDLWAKRGFGCTFDVES